jgi:transposase
VVRRTERALQRCLQDQLVVIDQAIERLCERDHTLADQVALLCTIPGMGSKSATQLLSYGGVALQERSAKELTAHAGLAPEHRQSGTSVRGRSHLNKQGDRRLRTVLYMPTLVATKYNPCIATVYHRLIHNGKPKKLALIACMRKLLIISRAMLRTKTPFNPTLALT